jgi:hypothetical protein
MCPPDEVAILTQPMRCVGAGQGRQPSNEQVNCAEPNPMTGMLGSHPVEWDSEREQLRRRLLRMIVRNELSRRHLSA